MACAGFAMRPQAAGIGVYSNVNVNESTNPTHYIVDSK